MVDLIIIAVIAIILACAIGYIVKAKKNGAKCIGCPSARQCASNSSKTSSQGSCSCNH